MKARMRRTQIYLEPDLTEALDRLARRRGATRAEVIRSAARRVVSDDAAERHRDPIWGILAVGRPRPGGPTDVSVDHDKYLAQIKLEKMRRFRPT